MSRKPRLSSIFSLPLAACVATAAAGCQNGGALDPFDNYTPGSTTQNPQPTAELPTCTSATPTAPCKLVFDDLSFTESGGCSVYAGDAGLGGTWSNPTAPSHLQFAANDTSVTKGCGLTVENRECGATLKNPPALLATIRAKQIKITVTQRYQFTTSATTTAGMMLDGLKVSQGLFHFGGSDLLTFTNSRHGADGKPELSPDTVAFSPGSDRSLTFSFRSQCYNVGSIPAYWYIDQVVAEVDVAAQP